MRRPRTGASPGGEAGLDDLDAQLVVEIPQAQQLRPPALVADQWVNADVGAHRVEVRPERRVLPDLLPARSVDPQLSRRCRLLMLSNAVST